MKIITLPNPILKKKCEPVADVNNEIKINNIRKSLNKNIYYKTN